MTKTILYTLVVSSALLLSCSQSTIAGPPYWAEVVTAAVSPENGQAQFTVQSREFPTLTNIHGMSGPYLTLRQGGEFSVEALTGSVVNEGSIAEARDPELRYVIQNNSVVAKDYSTLMMLSAYYQFEEIFQRAPQVLGVSMQEWIQDTGAYEVFFEPTFHFHDDALDGSVTLKANAFYLSGEQTFGLAQRSSLEQTPFAADIRILAHEFGHAVFDHYFYKNEPEECLADTDQEIAQNAKDRFFKGRLEIEYALAGMNEGFADFHSFAVTGGPNSLASLDERGDERNLRVPSFTYDDLAEFEPEECEGEYYCMGTLWARALYTTLISLGYDRLALDERGAFLQILMGALSKIPEGLSALPESIWPAPSALVAECKTLEDDEEERVLNHSATYAYNGKIAGAFLHVLIQNLPLQWHAPFCEAAIANFGEAGFPTAARAVCP